MATPELDVELLERAMSHIEAHPDQHDQRFFRRFLRPDYNGVCGTTMCMAGWLCELAGARWADIRPAYVVMPDGGHLHAADYAEQRTGLKPGQAARLFYTCEDAVELRSAVNEFIAEAQGAA